MHKRGVVQSGERLWRVAFNKLEGPVWCPESLVTQFFADPPAQCALDGPYKVEKNKKATSQPKEPKEEKPDAKPSKNDSKRCKKEPVTPKKGTSEESSGDETESEDGKTDSKTEDKAWIKNDYGEVPMSAKKNILEHKWLADAELRMFMRLLEDPKGNSTWVNEGQDPCLVLDEEKQSMYKKATGSTLACLHGCKTGHWTSASNFYNRPLFIEPFFKHVHIGFRKHLCALYPEKEGPTVVYRVNTFKQQDSWSCGYRACAYMYHMSRSTPLEDFADLYFDSPKLAQWMVTCLESWTVTPPPTAIPPTNAKRVLGAKVAKVVELHVTHEQSKMYNISSP